MFAIAYGLLWPLAQASVYDDAASDAPATKPAHPMSITDLQHGFRTYSSETQNNTAFRNSILGLMAVVAVVALAIHLYQRRQKAAELDSMRVLGRELRRTVHFPWGTKWLLYWVARANRTPFATLLLSSAHFDAAVAAWANGHTFTVLRHWGRNRLERLRPLLF